MADPRARADDKRRTAPSTPRWVVGFGVVAVVLVLAFVLLHLTGMAPTDHGM